MKRVLFCIFAMVIMGSAHAYTVSYDCGTSNGTAPTDSANYNSGDTVTVKPNTCTVPSGKHFAGYICGSTNVAAGNPFTISSNTTCTAQWKNGKFAVTTTEIPVNGTFDFSLSAIGTFTVDCGDGGTLSSSANPTDVSGDTITRTTTDATRYTCTWDNAGAHTITFDGTGTGYRNDSYPVIAFYIPDDNILNSTNATRVASISGSLYNLFPSTGTTSVQIPSFRYSFYKTSITQIPDTLFDGYTTSQAYMFFSTFCNCLNLESIPENLFRSITTASQQMFQNTFNACKNLISIPENLFSSFTNSAYGMFHLTFAYCERLTSIPSGLFSNFTTAANVMFRSTFFGCTGLTSLPGDLFAHFTSGAEDMFYSTFAGCTNLSGYIPPSLFAGLIANNATYETDMMKNIFYNTGLDTSCPNGTTRYETPYDEYWDGHVSCTPNTITINWNGATAAAIAANNAGTAVYGGDIRTPASYDPSLVPVGKRFVGWKFRKPEQN